MHALLIIDMQNAWLADPRTPRFDTAAVIARINHAADAIRRQGGKIIFVQHADADAAIGSAAWDVIPSLDAATDDARVHKLACDAFADTDLAQQLAATAADTLYICGFATEFCVDTTVRAAASRGLNIVVLSDAHTTSNRPHLDAESIIAHHNWIWTNMAVPANSTLAVRTTTQAFPTA